MKWLITACLSVLFILPASAEDKKNFDTTEIEIDRAAVSLALKEQNKVLEKVNSDLKTLSKEQKKLLADFTASLEAQQNKIAELSSRISETESHLNKSVSDVGKSALEAHGKVKVLDENLNKTSVQGIVALTIAALFGAVAILFLRKRMSASDSALEERISAGDSALDDRIKTARVELEAEAIKLDSRLIELLQNQLKVLEAERSVPAPVVTIEKVVDHTLPMRVAEEIIRMRGRLASLPTDTKGLKPLLKSLERLEEDFNQQGYEIEEMLNKQFNDGLNVKARFIPSDDLQSGEQIITKIIKPQINYNGTSIQVAEIEVSTGG